MKVSVIISVYKDVESLSLIVQSLLNQTVAVDEIIISEDGDSTEMKEYYQSLNNPIIKHLFQEDKGWRKNRALNRAIRESSYDYLLFLDGDCVPYPTWLEYHKILCEKDTVLCGRRTEPGNTFSKLLKSQKLSISSFCKNYIKNYFKLKKDCVRHYDEGISFHPNSWWFKKLTSLRNKENHIVGCHFSCWKSDLEKINGFDEDFELPTTGEDSDIERRMRHFGIKMKSCRFSASVIHLYHEKHFDANISSKTEALMEKKCSIFFCKNGLKSNA